MRCTTPILAAADPVLIRRGPTTQSDNARVKVNVLPREPKRLTDAPALHVTRRDRASEPIIAPVEEEPNLGWGQGPTLDA